MTDRSDDIKQLFSHLGLDHNVYQEMRTVSRPSVTITETPRRWSLLQSVAQPPAVAPIVPPPAAASPAVAPPAMPMPAPAMAPLLAADSAPPTTPRAPVSLAPGLTTSPAGVHRGEPATPLWPATGTPAAPPASASGRMSADESLRLLFQAVREPGPSADPGTAPTEGYDETLVVPASSVADTLLAAVPPPAPPLAPAAPPAPGPLASPAPTPVPPRAAMAAATPPTPSAPSTPTAGSSLNALFDRLRGASTAAEPAPGRLRLNVPKGT